MSTTDITTPPNTPTVIRGCVERLFYTSASFSTGVLILNDPERKGSKEVRFAGKAYVRVGELLVVRGYYHTDSKYGYQFRIVERLIETVVDPVGLASWLAVNAKFKGIGPVKAQRIASRFASDWLGWLEREPETIAREAGVSVETVNELAKSWGDAGQYNTVAVRLAAYELSQNQIDALWKKFKQSIIAILEDNPYLLLHEIRGLGFNKVDGIAQKAGFPENHPGRVEAAVEFALETARRDGSTCLPILQATAAAVEALGNITGEAGEDVEELVSAGIDRSCKRNRVVRTEHRQSELLAMKCCHKDETDVFAFCQKASQPNPHGHSPLQVLDLLHPDAQLDESQMVAVALAFTYRGCLISGGAGSGKSTTMKAVAELYQQCGHSRERIMLCAPTGKAARRLEEVTGFPASTIHRMLGYSSGFTFHRHNPLPADVVICDEMSMCDAGLAACLFDALGESTSIVMVGDHHQLPPVGAGSLLRDAIEKDLLPVALLEQCHRQAGPLKQNCHAILNGIVRPTTTQEEVGEGNPIPWYVVQSLNEPVDVLGYIEKLFTKVLQPRLGYDPVADVQFMSPTREGPFGCKAINILLQRLHQKTLGIDVPPRADDDSAKNLYIGDKVIQTQNDYNLQVMNGYQGRVLGKNPLTIDFGGADPVVIPFERHGALRLAYCITPHKAQGSEFPCAVTVCHRKNTYMLHRNWLYTAVTRARQTCILLGDAQGIQHAVRTVKVDQRCTLLPALAEAAERDGEWGSAERGG